ncbi:hypothetical protein JCM8097_008078 [Rhodosporidiobolus ruineniae]
MPAKEKQPDPLAGLTAERFLKLTERGDLPMPRLTLTWEAGELEMFEIPLEAKVFSSGAFGWTASGKHEMGITINDDPADDDNEYGGGEGDVRWMPISVSCTVNEDAAKEEDAEEEAPSAKKRKTTAGGVAAKRKGKGGKKGAAAKGGKKGKKTEEEEEESE